MQRVVTDGQGARPGRFASVRRHLFGAGLLAAAALLPAPDAAAEGKPLFELGLAGGGGWLPDYPAAGQNHFHYLAVPYLAYRGEFLRSDEKGLLRGRIVRTRSVEFDISLNGSFPVDSDDNDVRRGMPDLDYLGEVGPRLQITLARAARDAKLEFELPVRAVFSTDFSRVDYRGIVASPTLAYQHDRFFDGALSFKLGVAPVFATRELMDYFYEVEPVFATATRPAYAADAGYIGTRVEAVATRPFGERVRLFVAARADFHQGATNEDSPLFRDDTTFSLGAGIVVSLFQSARRVAE